MFRKRKAAAAIVKEKKTKKVRLYIRSELARNDSVRRQAIFSKERLAVIFCILAPDKKIPSTTSAIYCESCVSLEIFISRQYKVACVLMLFKFVAD